MLFTQPEFLLFYGAVLLWLLAVRNNSGRKFFLLIASYYFYAYWDYRFLGLVVFSTLVDYGVGLRLTRTERPGVRRALLLLSLTVNLGLLCVFKYMGFFVESLKAVLAPLGIGVTSLDVILPIGISFYTFQTLSYTIDVYRGQLAPCRSLLDFALFVAFFPQLVAGPIVRASQFLPQLKEAPEMSWHDGFLGFRQFVVGLFKKVYIADNMALFADYVFAHAGAFDGATTWLAVLAYAVQIYCDFSGYSDMAIGTARIMGYDLGVNFNFPYISRSVSEFWRRWHISLSTWLRDYLYIPLGGNRHGRVRTYINLMLTMLLGGLWHGAAWTFVFWGGLHGVALAVHRFYREHTGGLPVSARGPVPALWRLLGWAVTMLVALVGWVFFRAQTFQDAASMLRQMFYAWDTGLSLHPPLVLGLLALMLLVHLAHMLELDGKLELAYDRWHTPVVLFSMIWVVIIYRPRGFRPFVYFQF